MTDKVTLTALANLQNETTAVNAINANSVAVTTAMNNTLSRDGTSPNQMGASLDMNSNHIINLPSPAGLTEPLRLQDLTGFNTTGIIEIGLGSPIVILATGQSNFWMFPLQNWTPASNAHVWNWGGGDSVPGTAYIPIPNFVMNPASRFASEIATANPGRQVYLINISFGGEPISHWKVGTTAPDVFQNILGNITLALAAAGASKIDMFLWWQGESDTFPPLNPQTYEADFATVQARFTALSWYPLNTPLVIFGIAPTTISTREDTDVLNNKLQSIVRSSPDSRKYVHTGTFGPSYWQDTFHMNAAGYDLAGQMAAREYLSGSSRTSVVDPVSGFINNQVVGRPAYRNLITAGDLSTNPWQRGTTITSPASGAYTADGFVVALGGSAVFNVIKTADAPTIAQAGMYTQYCYHVDITTADVAIAAGDLCAISARLEGFNTGFLGFGQTGALPVTISFWVKSTKTGTFCVSLGNSASNRAYVAEYTVNSSDVWEFKSITIPGDVTGTWLNTNGIGLRIYWTLSCGSNFQSAGNVWAAGTLIGTANQVNATDNVNNNFKLALIQVEAGVGASPFEALPYGVVLSKCQRYLYIIQEGVAALFFGGSSTTSQAFATLTPPVPMRATPTGSASSAAHFAVYNASTNASTATATITPFAYTGNNFQINATVAGTPLTPGSAATISCTSSSGQIIYSSEL